MTSQRAIVFVAIALAVSAVPARAQVGGATGGMQPFRGLFGPPPSGSGRGESLDFMGSIYAGYDDNVRQDLPGGMGGGDPRFQVPSALFGTGAGLSYSRPGQKASFGAGAYSNWTYYAEPNDFIWSGATVTANERIRLSRSASLGLGAIAAYSPYYAFGAFLEPPTDSLSGSPPNVDLFLSGDKSFQVGANVGYSQRLSQRWALDASYMSRYVNFVDSPGASDYRDYNAAVSTSYAITRDLAARLGYGIRFGQRRLPDGTTEPVRDDSLIAGLDYGKTFTIPLGQRTTFSFGFGTSVATYDGDTRFNATGHAELFHRISRTWQAGAGYRRYVGFLTGVSEPFVNDQAYASVGGYVGTRLSLGASTAYSTGAGVSSSSHYDTLLTTAGAQYGITSNLAAYASYFYYQYYFSNPLILPVAVPQDFSRQGFRVGLSVWVPLLR